MLTTVGIELVSFFALETKKIYTFFSNSIHFKVLGKGIEFVVNAHSEFAGSIINKTFPFRPRLDFKMGVRKLY